MEEYLSSSSRSADQVMTSPEVDAEYSLSPQAIALTGS